MSEINYDLESRTKNFAINTRKIVRLISKSIYTIDDIRQVIRSSGSVASNYIEANEAISKKDFVYRIKIGKKEAKESGLWFTLLLTEDYIKKDIDELIQESKELVLIFSKIISSTKL